MIPHTVVLLCGITTTTSIIVSFLGIILHILNYRKPFEQRLIVRILAVVPLFAISCYSVLINYNIGRFIEPIREIYEAFVIYTFYKLLVLMLGGERRIILMTVDKQPTSHPFPTSLFLRKVNISDPKHFLMIKRCILQYVWFKPLLYLAMFITSILGFYDVNDVSLTSLFVWMGILYNISVTVSLYSLAMFWKCLYDELSVYNPWRKFLCVKLIIFASYWQGIIIGLFNWLGFFKEEQIKSLVTSLAKENEENLGLQIQNALLCLEMIFFAWLHWNSFPYTDFVASKIPDAARMETFHAMKDWIFIGDLIHDLKITTMYGDNYNLKNFDSITDAKIYNKSDTFNQKIYQGLRVSADGRKYWINMNDNDSIHKSDFNEYPSMSNKTSSGVSNINQISHNNDNSSTEGFRWFGEMDRNRTNRKNITKGDHIENQAKLTIGSFDDQLSKKSLDKGYKSKEPTETNGTITSATPLLAPNLEDSPSKRGYLSNIEDLIDEEDSFIFEAPQINDEESTRVSLDDNANSSVLLNEDLKKDEKLYKYVKSHYLSEEKINYPVIYEYSLNEYSSRISRLRQDLHNTTV